MPELLASENTTVFHYEGNTTPPTSYGEWNTVGSSRSKVKRLLIAVQVIAEVMRHLVDRYGIEEVSQWPLEVTICRAQSRIP